MTTELDTTKPAAFDLSPQTFDQALTFANYLAESDLVPKDFKGKPGNCLIAMQWGNELGLKPLQALQNLAVINGRPALWGDAVIALVRSSPACEYIVEEDSGDTATCRVKRRGEPEQVRTFSMSDAKAAGLAGKQGPWTQYPKRMRQMRARAFALRDVFPDVLRGLPVAEEVMDMPKDMGVAEVVQQDKKPAPDDALIANAIAAAENGMAAYQQFWAGITADQRKALAPRHGALKADAAAADKARTVETAPAQQDVQNDTATLTPDDRPAVTFDDLLTRLNAAQNEDAMYVVMDWTNELTDPAQVKAIEDRFNERLLEMRGQA